MRVPATRLTQTHKREAKGVSSDVNAPEPPKPPRICLGCGAPIIYGKSFCSSCGVVVARDELIKSANRGRIAAQSPEAQSRRTETQRRNAKAQLAWGKSDQTKISEEAYRNEIQPRLVHLTIPTIMSALNVCASYAADIRRGRRRPHARHWGTLGSLVGILRDEREITPQTAPLISATKNQSGPNTNAETVSHSHSGIFFHRAITKISTLNPKLTMIVTNLRSE
jgi:hypothetical protein